MPTYSFSLRELFDVAIELAPEERSACLDALCPEPDQRARLERMLALEHVDDTAFGKSSAEDLARAIGDVAAPPGFAPGNRIGQFELVDLLGEGGSSTVFRAVRDNDGVRQQVALKLLRRGVYSPDAQRQFRRERTALAQLTHPGIARLIEGGINENGLSYIALDLVEGQAITDYAREHKLGLAPRLELFMQVCRAVEAAHRALIVHRDLKPSNVLVNAEGQVKLIDFGIAKLLDADDETQTHFPAFTPAYAAPEQLSGDPITTATDVYALGILLGELVTGQRLNTGSERTPSGEIRIDAAAGVLPSTPGVTRRQLRGDLDNIVLKALAAEPERRYLSAGAFADDIERLQEGRPVSARQPTRWYRTGKFIRRHRGGVLFTTILVLAIFAALGLALWQANVARHEAQSANAVRDFLISLFDAARASLPRDQRPTPDVLVAQALRRIDTDGSLDGATRIRVLQALGEVSISAANFEQAEQLFMRAQTLHSGFDHSSGEMDLRVQHADALQRAGRNADAIVEMQTALPVLHERQSPSLVRALTVLAAAEIGVGSTEAAIGHSREAVASAAQVFSQDGADALAATFKLGGTLTEAVRFPEAVAVLGPAIERWRALALPEDERFVAALSDLAVSEDGVGNRPGSTEHFRELLALKRHIFEAPHDSIAHTLLSLGVIHIRAGNYVEADAELQEALAMFRKVIGENSVEVASTYNKLASLMTEQRRFSEAADPLGNAIAICERLGVHNDICANTHAMLGYSLYRQGRLDEARKEEERALDERRHVFSADSPKIAESYSMLANIAVSQHRLDEAVRLSAEALAVYERAGRANSYDGALVRNSYAQALFSADRDDDALREIDNALVDWQRVEPKGKTRYVMMLVLKAQILEELKRVDEQHRVIDEAIAIDAPVKEFSASTITLLRKLSGRADLYPDSVTAPLPK